MKIDAKACFQAAIFVEYVFDAQRHREKRSFLRCSTVQYSTYFMKIDAKARFQAAIFVEYVFDAQRHQGALLNSY